MAATAGARRRANRKLKSVAYRSLRSHSALHSLALDMASTNRQTTPTARRPGVVPRCRTVLLIAGAVGLCLAHGAVAGAEDDAPVDLTELSMETLLTVAVDSVSTASKHSQKTTRAPASVVVITADDIRRHGWSTLGEALGSVPGFHVSDNRNYQFLGVRGFSRPGDYNSRVLVLIDGHRTNDAIFGQGSIDPVFPLDMDLVDRIEVIRGPGSSLYGSGAFFGVVNVIPRTGAQMDGVEVAARAGSFTSRQGRLSAGRRFESGLEIIGSASADESAGNRRLVLADVAGQPGFGTGALGDGDAEKWGNAFLGLRRGEWKFMALQGAREKAFGTGLYGATFGDAYNRTHDRHQAADLQYDHETDAGALTLRASYHWYSYRSPMRFAAAPAVRYEEGADSQWWTTEARYQHRIGTRHRLTVGTEYTRYFENRLFAHDVEPAASYYDIDRPFATSAVYLQDETTLDERWTLTVGGRHDRLGMNASPLSGRVGLVYSPDNALSVKLLHGTAFRAPNAFEIYYQLPGFNKGNEALGPERIRTTELVVEQVLPPRLRLAASLYQYHVKNMVTQTVDPADGLLVYRNLDGVRTRGAELAVEGRWTGFTVRTSLAIQDTRDELTDERLSNAPRTIGRFDVVKLFADDRASVAFEVRQVGARFGDSASGQRPLVGGHAVADLTLVHAGLVPRLELATGIRNVFDRRFGDPTSGDDLVAVRAIPRDGRTWWVKGTLRF